MKKIVPFNNVLTFSTDISEITAISLEPVIEKASDLISGNFNISGEYKITDGMLPPESFSFNLPFDIALGSNYKLDTLNVEVDDFRYELINSNQMKVYIDLSIDGEEEETREEPNVLPEAIERNTIEAEETEEDNEEELFNPSVEEKYVTYRVYRVTDGDTLDDILKKYDITKEELEKYNDLETINPGSKLIIPSNDN